MRSNGIRRVQAHGWVLLAFVSGCDYPAEWRCQTNSCPEAQVCKGSQELPEGALPNHASGTDCYQVCSTEGLLTHVSGCDDPERACLGEGSGVGVCVYFETG